MKSLHSHVKDIGLIWDSATTCMSDKAKNHILKMSEKCLPRIHSEFVEGGLTPVQSPPDVAVIKPFKKECRLGSEKILFGRRGVLNNNYKLSREEIVGTVLDAVKKINLDNIEDRHIKNSFDICGVNPWSNDPSKFEKHLDNLSENKTCKALIANNNDNDID